MTSPCTSRRKRTHFHARQRYRKTVNALPCDKFACKTGILALAAYNSQTKKLLYGHPLYFLKIYETPFLGHHQSNKILAIRGHVYVSKCGKHEKIGEIVLFQVEGEVIVAGRTVEVVRDKYQAKRTVCGDALWSHSKILWTSHFDGTQLKNFQCKVRPKVVLIDKDMQDDCKRLKAGCLVITDFKVWLTKVMAWIGAHRDPVHGKGLKGHCHGGALGTRPWRNLPTVVLLHRLDLLILWTSDLETHTNAFFFYLGIMKICLFNIFFSFEKKCLGSL